jgi:hypothetical protein
VFSPRSDPRSGSLSDDDLTPEEEAALTDGLDRVRAEKRRALEDPGPSWREWFLYSGSKWWIGVGFLIVDVFVSGTWIADGAFSSDRLIGALASLAVALYLEILIYGYLWRRPTDAELAGNREFRPGALRLRQVGRWTPEGTRFPSGRLPVRAEDGAPSPHEFL